MGGLEGLTNGWPLWRDDHPLYYHSALVTRAFFHQSGTTAGYDPAFMAGYAKSVVFPASSTLPELVVWALGGNRPELAYKLYVLVTAVALPWLVALAAAAWRLRVRGAALAVLLFLLYLWIDFPINYAAFGMLPYLLAIPLGLLATGLFGGYLIRGGILRWLLTTSLMSLAVMVHLTAAMVVVPAAAFAYLAALTAKDAESSGDFGPGCWSARQFRWRGSSHRAKVLRLTAYRCLVNSALRTGEQRLLVAAGPVAGIHQGGQRFCVCPFLGRSLSPLATDRHG